MVIAFTGTRGLPYQASSDRLEYQVELTALELTKRNHSVHVLTDPEYSDLDSYQGISLHPTKSSAWATFRTLLTIPNLDVVHIMSLNQALLVALLSIFRPKVRLFISINHYHTSKKNRFAQWTLFRRIQIVSRFANEIIVDRTELREFFIQHTTKPVHLLETPLDIHLTRQNGSIKTWNLSRRQYILLHSHHKNDQKTLRLMLISLKKNKLLWPIVIMGSVSPEIKAEFTAETIHFIGGVSGQTEREIIANARYFIDTAASNEDKYPLLMAMAHSTPVLSEYTSTHRSWIKRNGLYYYRENLASMIHSVRFMEESYTLISHFAYNYAPVIRENHTTEGFTNRLVFVYVNAFTQKKLQDSQSLERISIPIQ